MSSNFVRKLDLLFTSIRFLILGTIVVITVPALSAQKSVSPADTGRIKWGHSDFRGYDRAGMCNRTLDEVDRQYTRIYVKDTSFEPIRGSKSYAHKLSKAAVEAVQKCISHLNMDQQASNQLWVIARIYMAIGDFQKSRDIAVKAIATGINRGEQLEMMIQAMEMSLNLNGGSLDNAHFFAKLIHADSSAARVARFKADFLIATYYYILYEPDSVFVYTNSVIDILRKMTGEEMDSVPAVEPFTLQINIANVRGDIAAQEKIVETGHGIVSKWRNGLGSRFISGYLSGIEMKKSTYNRKINALDGGIWENFDGASRPLIGKPSLFITVNHNCQVFCHNQLNSIKRLKKTFGDSLDLVLITSTMGYGPGSGPLTPKEEAKVAAKVMAEIYDLPYTLFVSESPTHKLDDGRIIREKSPVMQILSEIGNASAIVTDAKGRVQWIGDMQNEWHMRAVIAVIDRALNDMNK